MEKVYYYRYTTNPELIKEFGDNFFVQEYEIEEEFDNEVYVKDYDYVRKESIGNVDDVLNESFHGKIDYTWFSYKNDKETMNEFKNEVRHRLLEGYIKLVEEANDLLKLLLKTFDE